MKLSLFYKKIIENLFIIIYGKVITTNKKIKNLSITKLDKINNENLSKYNYYLYKLNQGRVFTNYVENIAIILKNILIKEVSFQQINSKLQQHKNETLFTGTPKIQKKIHGTVLVLTQGASGHNNYAHWLLDIIPKIKLVSSVYDLKKIDFFLFSKLNHFQKQSLKIMNIDIKKFIDSNEFRHLTADNLLAVNHPYLFKKNFFFSQSHIPDWIIKYLRNFFLKKEKKTKFKKLFKIYIDRSDSKTNHCKLINNNELITFFKKKKFKILKLSQMSFEKQISVFNNSKIIVSPHGAGLANTIFCRKNTKILEFFPKNHSNRVYKRISAINNLKYNSIYSKKIKDKTNGDIYIDLKSVTKLIKNYS